MIKLVQTAEKQYTIYYTYSTPSEARDRLMDKMFKLSKGTERRDFWWRATNNKNEHEICENLRSKNHADGTMESGISVSESVAYQYFHGYKYIYAVSGEVIGTGSDGEPILKNAKALTKPSRKPSKRYLDKEEKLSQLSEELNPLYLCGLRSENVTSQYGEYDGNEVLLEG
jgi:hypothetical protein